MRINSDQRGLLFKKGDFIKVLSPGNYWIKTGQSVELYDISKPFTPQKDLTFLLRSAELSDMLIIHHVQDNQLALRYEDGKYCGILTSGKYAFWKGLVEHTIKIIDITQPEVSKDIDPIILSKPEVASFLSLWLVEPWEKALLHIDKKFHKILEPGAYRFWKSGKVVQIDKVDLRQQQIEVPGQELMSKDKVTLRLNFVCQFKIINPEKIILEIRDYTAQLYILLQLVLREYISTFTLDEILEKKEEIGKYVTEKLKESAHKIGLEIIFTGVKDVILPGEIKDILNQVLIAEKKAQANVIMRREETASTRSLLNTAKLMEDNQLLYKLKELEYVERISEKINQITLAGGGQLLEQLKELFISKK